MQQTDVRQKHRLMPPPYGGGGITSCAVDTLCPRLLQVLTYIKYSLDFDGTNYSTLFLALYITDGITKLKYMVMII